MLTHFPKIWEHYAVSGCDNMWGSAQPTPEVPAYAISRWCYSVKNMTLRVTSNHKRRFVKIGELVQMLQRINRIADTKSGGLLL
jgi:hypothetical protein